MITVKIVRKKISLQYKQNSSAPADWHNNDAHNSLDSFIVYKDGNPLGLFIAQTVANLEGLDAGVHFTDTIVPGSFHIRVFVPGRQHYGRVHGIVGAQTMAGDLINDQSITAKNPYRWLVHDWEKLNDANPPGVDTRVAWSAGCIVLPDKQLYQFGQILDSNGIRPGDLIPTTLEEEV